jgi:formate/nitrite transporter FocA (FNT family)
VYGGGGAIVLGFLTVKKEKISLKYIMYLFISTYLTNIFGCLFTCKHD